MCLFFIPLSSAQSINQPRRGVTHRFYTGRPVFTFGFGLSYTSWKYGLAASPASVSLAPLRALVAQTHAANRTFVARDWLLAAAPPARYQVNVTNTGSVDSDEVVLGFLVPPGAGIGGVPLQSLFGFSRVRVRAGESEVVELYPELLEYSQVDRMGRRYALSGEYTVRFGVKQTATMGGGFVEHRLTAA